MNEINDVNEDDGVSSTWLGKAHQGKGYNQVAKELFLNEIFEESPIQTIFLKVRTNNYRSQKAVLKLDYITQVDEAYETIFQMINQTKLQYHLYTITRLSYLAHLKQQEVDYISGVEET